MNLPDNLKKLRANRKLSQKRVADMLDIPRTTYSSYEYGVCDPSMNMLVKLSDLFNTTIDSLVK